jgi:Helix-turn-helix domain
VTKNRSHTDTSIDQSEQLESRANAEKLLTPKQTAEFLGISEGTLATWRCVQRYKLAYVKVGSRVMYRPVDLETFVASCTVLENQSDGKMARQETTSSSSNPASGRSSQMKGSATRKNRGI